ncbi:MAG: type II toxin-antitoxin system HicB family antitoxin [Proteobacteria bacterium]|nr:type II toxin-antitoxin system HicB family antitoxin [Pseudomonadota bacterium]
MNYHFRVKKEKTGFSAECVELPGCVTQGETREELSNNMEEALNLFLDEPPHSKTVFPLPKQGLKGRNLIPVPVEPRVAFAFVLRMIRLKHRLSQKAAAARIGISGSLNNYQRLESSSTANPVLETLVKIRRAFPDFPIELITG